MGREPGDHRDAEPVQVIGELVQLGTFDAGIDQDQPIIRAHHDGVGPDPLALPDPDAVGHLFQLAHLHSNRLVTVLRLLSAAEIIAFSARWAILWVQAGRGRINEAATGRGLAVAKVPLWTRAPTSF